MLKFVFKHWLQQILTHKAHLSMTSKYMNGSITIPLNESENFILLAPVILNQANLWTVVSLFNQFLPKELVTNVPVPWSWCVIDGGTTIPSSSFYLWQLKFRSESCVYYCKYREKLLFPVVSIARLEDSSVNIASSR